MLSRITPRIIPFAVVAALLWPLTFHAPRDSFPLSSYPMFARAKASARLTMHYFVAVAPDGSRSFVAPADVANGEVLQARSVISGTVNRGRAASRQLCDSVARRLAGRPGYAGSELRLVRGRHDAIAYLTGRDTVGVEKLVVKCPIPAQVVP